MKTTPKRKPVFAQAAIKLHGKFVRCTICRGLLWPGDQVYAVCAADSELLVAHEVCARK